MIREPATNVPDAREALIMREEANAALAKLPDK
jgi:hypothetical protein